MLKMDSNNIIILVSKKYENIPGADKYIVLDNLRSNNTVWSNGGCNIIDIGDGILKC